MRGAGAVELGVGGDEHVGAAVVDSQPPQAPLGDELVDRRPDPRDAAPEPPVLLDARVGEHAARAHRLLGERAQPLVLGRDRRVELRARDHPLGQVVDALESLPARDHEVAVVPEPFEHRLGRLPVPHPAAGRALEVARGERAALADLGQDLLARGGGASCRPAPYQPRPPFSIAVRKSGQNSIGSRQASCAQYSKIRPPASSRETRVARVVADAAREGDPVAPLDRRDRVELDA